MDDIIYKQLKTRWKLLTESNIVNELSISADLQNEPTWNNPEYDKSILNSKPIHTFLSNLKEYGEIQVNLYKTDKEYIFINNTNKEKIAEIEYKKIDITQNGKIIRGVECDYKVVIIGNYRGKGFSYIMYDAIINHNTITPGIWCSDTKLSPANQKVWKTLTTKYNYSVLISNGRTPALWIDVNDDKNIERFRLQHYVEKLKENKDVIWEEKWDTERFRILLKIK